MKRQMFFLSCAAMVYLFSHNSFSADSADSKIQLLNSQIQTQLQHMQEDQQKQMTDLNKKIQDQLKEIKGELDSKIKEVNSIAQEKMQKIQEELQAQIKQINTRRG